MTSIFEIMISLPSLTDFSPLATSSLRQVVHTKSISHMDSSHGSTCWLNHGSFIFSSWEAPRAPRTFLKYLHLSVELLSLSFMSLMELGHTIWLFNIAMENPL